MQRRAAHDSFVERRRHPHAEGTVARVCVYIAPCASFLPGGAPLCHGGRPCRAARNCGPRVDPQGHPTPAQPASNRTAPIRFRSQTKRTRLGTRLGFLASSA